MLPRPLSEHGPLLRTLTRLIATGQRQKARETVLAVRRVLETEDGRILLDLLEKSTGYVIHPVLEDVRALAATNAQAFIALDLRRIVSNEVDAILAPEDDPGPRRRRSGRGT